MNDIQIDGRAIGIGHPPYIIAEAGANANGDINLALKLVEKAAEAGADAIKFQHYKAENLATKTAPKYYVDTMEQWESGAEPSGSQYDEFSQLDGLTFSDWQKVKKYCDCKKITFLSTPFDFDALETLVQLNVPAYKIASADITYHALIKAVAEKQKPVILSTGASTLDDIKEAVSVIESTGNKQIILLQCTLHYPCHFNEVNLNVILTLKNEFPDYEIGFSDHSLGIQIPIVAAAIGASVIEKHYTIDKNLPKSTDHFMSVDPIELKEMSTLLHHLSLIMGNPEKKQSPNEDLAVKYARRSLVATKDINPNEIISTDNTTFKRPGMGIPPLQKYSKLLGRMKAKTLISLDSVITFNMVKLPGDRS